MHTNPEVLALLALGEDDSATTSEREHVASCEVCSGEVAELARLAGIGRSAEGSGSLESPRPQVWERIRDELGFAAEAGSTDGRVPPVSPVASPPPSPTPSPREVSVSDSGPKTPASRRVLALVLAAVIALIVGVGIGLGWSALSRQSPTVIGEAQLTPAAPAWEGASGEATLERDASGQRILVVRVSTPRTVPGIRVVWVMNVDSGGMQTLGQLTSTEGRFPIESTTNLALFPVVDVSEEPENDPDPKHSGKSIVRGTLDI
jgi:hypothetical protein